MGYEHIEIERRGHVGIVWLNRPEKRNALSEDMWADIPAAMADLDGDDDVRAIVLAARGSAFSVGIDINLLASLQPAGESAAPTRRWKLRKRRCSEVGTPIDRLSFSPSSRSSTTPAHPLASTRLGAIAMSPVGPTLT